MWACRVVVMELLRHRIRESNGEKETSLIWKKIKGILTRNHPRYNMYLIYPHVIIPPQRSDTTGPKRQSH